MVAASTAEAARLSGSAGTSSGPAAPVVESRVQGFGFGSGLRV